MKGNQLLTPPKDHRILPGTTYDVVLELAVTHNIPHAIRDISESELHTAEEIMLTSSTKEILPITQLDRHSVGNGTLPDLPATQSTLPGIQTDSNARPYCKPVAQFHDRRIAYQISL